MDKYVLDPLFQPILRRLPEWVTPNHLTVARAACLAPLWVVGDSPPLTIVVVLASAWCDLADGSLARLRKMTTEEGATLDALCDKFFTHFALWTVCWNVFSFWLLVLALALDIFLTLLRRVKDQRGVTTRANLYGAIKVWAQTIAIIFALMRTRWSGVVATTILGAAILFAMLSFYGHCRDLTQPAPAE